MGQAYAEVKYWDQVLTAGDSEYNTPYVNRQFNRMTPNTFEGVSLKGSITGLQAKNFDYLVGYLSKIKQRNADEFVPMSQLLGTADNYYGTGIAQFLFKAWGASIGLSEYYTPQNLNIFYADQPGRRTSAPTTISKCQCSIPGSGLSAAHRLPTASPLPAMLARARPSAMSALC